MDKYDKALWHEIFNNQVYKSILDFLDRIDIFFDIGGYKGYFSKYLIDNWFVWKIVFIEPIKEFLIEAKKLLKDYPNITFLNIAIWKDINWLVFYRDLSKSGHSGFYLPLAWKKFKFFKSSNIVKIKPSLKTFEEVLRFYQGKIGIKLDIEWSEWSILTDKFILEKIDFLICEYHIFSDDMEKSFEYFKLISKNLFDKVEIRPSSFTSDIGYIIAYKGFK